jgi:microsomal epoxide hydrolase
MSVSSLNSKEQEGLKRGEDFVKMGSGYSLEHATRPSTIGLVLGSSPVALLAWIGEKFLAWSDVDPELEKILESVTLYWLTETFPSSVYPYRAVSRPPLLNTQTFFPRPVMQDYVLIFICGFNRDTFLVSICHSSLGNRLDTLTFRKRLHRLLRAG